MADNSKIEWTDATWNPAERFRDVPGHPYEFGFDLRLVYRFTKTFTECNRGVMVGAWPESRSSHLWSSRRNNGSVSKR